MKLTLCICSGIAIGIILGLCGKTLAKMISEKSKDKKYIDL